jgi:hypothetical protein
VLWTSAAVCGFFNGHMMRPLIPLVSSLELTFETQTSMAVEIIVAKGLLAIMGKNLIFYN